MGFQEKAEAMGDKTFAPVIKAVSEVKDMQRDASGKVTLAMPKPATTQAKKDKEEWWYAVYAAAGLMGVAVIFWMGVRSGKGQVGICANSEEPSAPPITGVVVKQNQLESKLSSEAQ